VAGHKVKKVASISSTCLGCHGGTGGTDDKKTAHQGMTADPSINPDKACGQCHAEVVKIAETSLHYTINGYKTNLSARGFDFDDHRSAKAFSNHCTACHATCGQCHISRPRASGGGLVAGHKVKKVASISSTCLGCHGGRVGPEYQGKNKGVPGDVHWLKGGMPCVRCHTTVQFHGDGKTYTTRYDGPVSPNCLDCHPQAAPGKGQVTEHKLHGNKVACQVCHSAGPYKNCYGCHVGLDDNGLPYRKLPPSKLEFKIGRNPLPGAERPWQFVLLRHVPVPKDHFAYYGADLLPGYDRVPTWKYTTPHNIQRKTPQNKTCNSCHGNTDLFLTAKDIPADELAVNGAVIVEKAPEPR
jgi:thiosulfate/3-mercaptopyruvate sulfurtransferase